MTIYDKGKSFLNWLRFLAKLNDEDLEDSRCSAASDIRELAPAAHEPETESDDTEVILRPVPGDDMHRHYALEVGPDGEAVFGTKHGDAVDCRKVSGGDN